MKTRIRFQRVGLLLIPGLIAILYFVVRESQAIAVYRMDSLASYVQSFEKTRVVSLNLGVNNEIYVYVPSGMSETDRMAVRDSLRWKCFPYDMVVTSLPAQ